MDGDGRVWTWGDNSLGQLGSGNAKPRLVPDVLASPTMPTPPFERGESLDDPLQMYLADANTVPINLANLPAISVPAGETDGLPVGLQLVGPAFGEERIVRAASALEG